MNAKIYDDQLIVVTGAAGFIGSAVVRCLNDRGLSNLLLVDDIGKTDKWKNLLGKRYTDIISKHDLFKWLEGREREIEAFIHLGADSDTLESDVDYLLENNYRYTVRLAEYALEHGHRFIYASSAATYGDGLLGFCDDHDLLEELRPLNAYGFSKHQFDLWAKRQGVLNTIVGLKYFNIFGPNENHKGRMASMVHKMFPVAEQNKAIALYRSSDPKLYADGEQKRDFLYVKDAACMTCLFLDNDQGGIFHIGRGEATAWNTLATALFKALSKDPRIEYIDMPKDLIKQYQNYTCADMRKFHKAYKYAFRYSIPEAIDDYVGSYLVKDARW